jgi:hypothetical protein
MAAPAGPNSATAPPDRGHLAEPATGWLDTAVPFLANSASRSALVLKVKISLTIRRVFGYLAVLSWIQRITHLGILLSTGSGLPVVITSCRE